MSALAAFVALLLLQGGVVGGQVQGLPAQPRDPRAAPTAGTGVIKGRVTAADTGAPFRRAIVQLGGGPRPRAVYTDDDGRYVFEAVLPGSYSVSANPGQHRANYRASSHGADPSRAFMAVPSRISVANGQVLENIDIAIPRNGAVVGRVVDPYGEPASRVQVRLLMLRPGQEPMQTGPGASTDDLGQFRVFGVPPGDYVVVADPQMGGPGGEIEGERLGFARTFAPGVHSPGEAARVRVGSGTEALAEIRLLETAVFNVRGTVMNSRGEPVRNASVSMMRTDIMSGGTGSGTDPSGTFTIRNVTPGTYELVVQHHPPDARPGPNGRMEGREMATLRVDVATADIDGLQLVTAPGASFSGQIVFEDAPPPGARVQLNLQPAQLRNYGPGGSIEVKDQTFTATDVFGPVLIRGNVLGGGPRPAGAPPVVWALKEVLLNGKDITDVPTVFTGTNSGRVQVVFTSRTAAIEGRVLDDAGQALRGAMVMAFSADEEHWTPGSSRIRTGMASGDGGEFAVRGLRPGRYYVVAIQANGPIGSGPSGPDREFLRMLKGSATEVVVNENESRSVDLRVVRIE